MAHEHSIYDNDTHFVIDLKTREIKNDIGKTVIVQNDHNSERFSFELPKEIEGHDMSLCNVVQVHYLNIDSKTKEQHEGLYVVDDLQISPDGDDVVILSWLLSQEATRAIGSLYFGIAFKCVNDDGTLGYAWHTAINKDFKVVESLENSDVIIEENPDILAQLEARLAEVEKNGGGSVDIDLSDYVTKDEMPEINVDDVVGKVENIYPAFSVDEWFDDSTQSSATGITNSEGFCCMPMIEVEPSTQYVVSIGNLFMLNAKGGRIDLTVINDSGNGRGAFLFTTPENCDGLLISIHKESYIGTSDINEVVEDFNSTFMLVKGDTLPTEFVPYGEAYYKLKDNVRLPDNIEIPESDFVLTEEDKAEIAEMAAELVEVPEGGNGGFVNSTSVFVNVKDFGAVGDGVTDDTQAIQNAIDSIQNGGTIFFPCGTYLLKRVLFNASTSNTAHALRCYSNQRLLFDKGAILKRGSADITHILFTHNESNATGYDGASNIEIIGATVDANVINNADAITGQCTSFNISHAKNIKITDCTFINGGTSWHSIEVNSSRDVVIDSCGFSNNQNSEDIQLDAAVNSGNLGTSDGTVTKDIHIKNCIFDITNNAAAIGNHSNAAHCNTRIHDNVFRGGANTSRGYIDFVASHEKVDIYNNTFYNGAYGVVLKTSTTNSAIFNNRFEGVSIPMTGGYTSFNNIINGYLEEGNGADVNTELVEIPEGYTALAYLESDGNQYIDTGYIPKTSSIMQFANWARISNVERYQTYAGCCSSDNAMDTFALREYQSNNSIDYHRGGDNALFNDLGIAVSTAELIILNNTNITVDGTKRTVKSSSGTSLNGAYSLYLFACNLAGTAWRSSACRFGTVTFSENNAYIKYLVPCLDTDNRPCYFDRVSGITLYNAGTGEFTYETY